MHRKSECISRNNRLPNNLRSFKYDSGVNVSKSPTQLGVAHLDKQIPLSMLACPSPKNHNMKYIVEIMHRCQFINRTLVLPRKLILPTPPHLSPHQQLNPSPQPFPHYSITADIGHHKDQPNGPCISASHHETIQEPFPMCLNNCVYVCACGCAHVLKATCNIQITT
jgi:hypothetical protein